MNKIKCLVGLFAALTVCCQTFAQVAVNVQLNRKTYHQYEPVIAKVKLKNFSGTPLIFGSSDTFKGELIFHIVKPGDTFSRSTELLRVSLDNLILPPGVTKDATINLGKSYNFDSIGNHKIKVIASHTTLTDKYESNIIGFNVSQGFKVWETSFGVPDLFATEAGSKVAKRTYRVTSLFDGVEPVYYLIVEDSKKIYSVKRIGKDLGVAQPQFTVDNLSQLHVLVSSTVRSFNYHIFDIDGLNISTDEYLKKDTTPRFMEDPNTGKVLVVGGEKSKRS